SSPLSLILCFHFLSFPRSSAPLHLCSFPTRRSSDLSAVVNGPYVCGSSISARLARRAASFGSDTVARRVGPYRSVKLSPPLISRSEEHTSELQSRFDLVCRLLLEKKKKLIYLVYTSC